MSLAHEIEVPAGSVLSVNHNGDLEYLPMGEFELTHRDLMDLKATMSERIIHFSNLELV